ncbi:MAG TPA: NUDIX domain-containing protein [Streptosporangiaceae bacterium]|nr:NUDIX domain-containing protein [Streptosporangiaceae bacterium]
MNRLIARLWHSMRGSVQWRVLWLANAKFMVGVTGVVRDESGQVLLLRHRLWPEGRQWGLPTGYAKAGESFPDTIVREVREETGLTVTVGELARVRSGYRLRVEVAYEAIYVGGELRLGSLEILEAGWFPADSLPAGLVDTHLALIRSTSTPHVGS